ncbi:hypothetical protein LBMAG42_28270 [Deltaproteobacteria bacterium]|nr:hypothetical protein LBMAG42_28270 [Deltaproteobacteria bacterium]
MSFLDSVQLAYTCPLAWEKLLGNDQKRFCMDCQKHVTNLSAMTRGQAETYLHANADAPICVRVEVDAKGRAVHRPALSAAAAVAMSLSAVACGGDDDSADSGRVGGASVDIAAQHDEAGMGAAARGARDGTSQGASSTSIIPEVGQGGPTDQMGQVPAIRQMMGEPPAITTVPVEPTHQVMGGVRPIHETMGRPATVKMGKIKREPEPEPEPEPTEEVMGLW